MSKMLQIRNVPDELHGELRRRAKNAGSTLTDYVQHILEREVSRPPREEIISRIKERSRVKLDGSAAEYVAEARREAS